MYAIRSSRAAHRLRSLVALPAAATALLAGACADASDRLIAPRPALVAAAPDSSDDTGRAPARAKWTVMVYLAADNNLALDGVTDLGEMEAAVAKAATGAGAAASDVNVVVEAEFSPQHLARAGCASPACLGLTSWNTFRYAVKGRAAGAPGYGPAGAVIDLGANRDMTRPEELRDFVRWAKREHPAEHYMLVLWNHGGGYTGLIADETSAGGRLMTVDQMRLALADAGRVDVVDFDMCLMAGYETLAKLHGFADYAVFSEAVVPGAGNEYRSLLGAIFERPRATPAEVAAAVTETFHASYAGNRASTTVSAYALAPFPAFEAKLGRLARALRADASATTPLVRDAARRSQKYEQPGLHDLGHFLALLSTGVDERSELYKAIEGVFFAALDSSFRVRSFARNGSGAQASDVRNSSGLHILVPSGEGTDVIAATGPGSFDAYAALMPDREWTRFLADYLYGAKATTMVDQGEGRFEAYLVWEEDAVKYDADVDFWLIEPDGSLYIPYLGRVTPNGQLTNDSAEDDTFYEGFASFRVVAKGTYYVLANLFDDPENFRPLYNLAYRFGQDDEFDTYFDRPRLLTKRKSWLDDTTPTLEEIFDGAYTDLQAVASWNSAGSSGGAASAVADTPSRRPRLTPAQLTTARRLVAERGAEAKRGLAGRPMLLRDGGQAPNELARLLPRVVGGR